MASKNEIRRNVRRIRDDHGPSAAASDEVCARLLGLEAVRDAKAWFIYASTGGEVGTHDLIRNLLARGDIVAVPRVIGPQDIVAQQIYSFDELRLSEFGILAPPPGDLYTGAIDVCICPGIAFTERGDRLGSGRGFYDRFLSAHSPRLAIGLAFECQLVTDLPVEIHDRRMDWIVTERREIQIVRASR